MFKMLSDVLKDSVSIFLVNTTVMRQLYIHDKSNYYSDNIFSQATI